MRSVCHLPRQPILRKKHLLEWETFYLRGEEWDIGICPYAFGEVHGRIKKFTYAIEDMLGIKLYHDKEIWPILHRCRKDLFPMWERPQWKWAYFSSYTSYVELRELVRAIPPDPHRLIKRRRKSQKEKKQWQKNKKLLNQLQKALKAENRRDALQSLVKEFEQDKTSRIT